MNSPVKSGSVSLVGGSWVNETGEVLSVIDGWVARAGVINEGLRFDEGKLPLHLIPPELDEEVAKVLDYGSRKYAPRNWEKGMDWSRVVASLKRHLLEFEKGIDVDPETGLLHTAHIGCNIAFLIAYQKRGIGTDDRPSKT